MKHLFVFGFHVLAFIAGSYEVNGAGECGRTSPEMEAFKLTPCAEAAQDENALVSAACCVRVQQIGRNPICLCAVMLSDTAKSAGAKPEIAVTIPKPCNLADRPVGCKCGAYTLPSSVKSGEAPLHVPGPPEVYFALEFEVASV